MWIHVPQTNLDLLYLLGPIAGLVLFVLLPCYAAKLAADREEDRWRRWDKFLADRESRRTTN